MYCKNCGKEIDGNFCSSCGTNNEENQIEKQHNTTNSGWNNVNSNNPSNNTPGIKCPKCGSSNLQAIADVQGKGASFWKICLCGILGLCGTGKTKTTHYWVCQNCGNKFKM